MSAWQPPPTSQYPPPGYGYGPPPNQWPPQQRPAQPSNLGFLLQLMRFLVLPATALYVLHLQERAFENLGFVGPYLVVLGWVTLSAACLKVNGRPLSATVLMYKGRIAVGLLCVGELLTASMHFLKAADLWRDHGSSVAAAEFAAEYTPRVGDAVSAAGVAGSTEALETLRDEILTAAESRIRSAEIRQPAIAELIAPIDAEVARQWEVVQRAAQLELARAAIAPAASRAVAAAVAAAAAAVEEQAAELASLPGRIETALDIAENSARASAFATAVEALDAATPLIERLSAIQPAHERVASYAQRHQRLLQRYGARGRAAIEERNAQVAAQARCRTMRDVLLSFDGGNRGIETYLNSIGAVADGADTFDCTAAVVPSAGPRCRQMRCSVTMRNVYGQNINQGRILFQFDVDDFGQARPESVLVVE